MISVKLTVTMPLPLLDTLNEFNELHFLSMAEKVLGIPASPLPSSHSPPRGEFFLCLISEPQDLHLSKSHPPLGRQIYF